MVITKLWVKKKTKTTRSIERMQIPPRQELNDECTDKDNKYMVITRF